MRAETAVTLALLALHSARGTMEVGTRTEVLETLSRLANESGSTLGVRFRPSPTGPQSEDVARFLGRLAMSGYLVQESPIRLTERGLSLLVSHVESKASEPDVRQAVEILGIPEIGVPPTAPSIP